MMWSGGVVEILPDPDPIFGEALSQLIDTYGSGFTIEPPDCWPAVLVLKAGLPSSPENLARAERWISWAMNPQPQDLL